jgi:hypothetical protein
VASKIIVWWRDRRAKRRKKLATKPHVDERRIQGQLGDHPDIYGGSAG